MEVILLEKIANLGALGDRVTVKAGYGRNYLIPQAKAVAATLTTLRLSSREEPSLKKTLKSYRLQRLVRRRWQHLNSQSQRMLERKKLFGSVGARDIAQAAVNACGARS